MPRHSLYWEQQHGSVSHEGQNHMQAPEASCPVPCIVGTLMCCIADIMLLNKTRTRADLEQSTGGAKLGNSPVKVPLPMPQDTHVQYGIVVLQCYHLASRAKPPRHVQVLSKALEVWDLQIHPLEAPEMADAKQHPDKESAFICNLQVLPALLHTCCMRCSLSCWLSRCDAQLHMLVCIRLGNCMSRGCQ